MWPSSARRWRFRYTVPRLMRGSTLRTRAKTRSALGCSTPELRTASSTTESWRVLRRVRGRSAAIADPPARFLREREAHVLHGRELLRRLPPRLERGRHAELAAHLERHVLVDPDQAVDLLPEPALVLDLDEQRRRERPRPGEERVVDRELLADGVQVGDVLDPEHLLRLIPDRRLVLEQEAQPVAHRHPPGALVGDDPAPDRVALGAVALSAEDVFEADGPHGRQRGRVRPW